jgi:hypothetical protein
MLVSWSAWLQGHHWFSWRSHVPPSHQMSRPEMSGGTFYIHVSRYRNYGTWRLIFIKTTIWRILAWQTSYKLKRNRRWLLQRCGSQDNKRTSHSTSEGPLSIFSVLNLLSNWVLRRLIVPDFILSIPRIITEYLQFSQQRHTTVTGWQ